jgi:hypothetical protein
MKLFSAFAAAELLERDRQTIARALRNTPPDGRENNQPRWKMSTIVDAVKHHSGVPIQSASRSTGTDDELMAVYAAFDVKFNAMAVLPTLALRRAAACELAPEIAGMDQASRQRARANGVGDELADLRADQLYRLCMRGFEKPCEWTSAQCWENLDATADVD